MARYNTVIPATTTSAAANITSPSQGLFTSLTGTAPYTVTIGDPVLFSGSSQTFYNGTNGIVTLSFTSSGSGKFIGPAIPGNATTLGLPASSVIAINSDGTNWVVAFEGGSALSASTFTASSTVTLSPSSANVDISPTGTGTVTISPAGALTINPTALSSINNTTIGVTTRAAANFTSIGATARGSALFTTLDANSTVGLSPSNASVTISPTGSGSVVINPATAGTIDNIAIGATTRAAGNFTTLNSNGLTRMTQGGQGSTATDAAHAVLITGGLGVSGTLYTVGLVETSSIAFKENINPITNALDAILNLTGVTYDRKDNKQHEAGLIAEHVYEHAPDLVALDANGKPHGIHYTKISAYLIECIKTLQAEIDELKGKKKTKGSK